MSRNLMRSSFDVCPDRPLVQELLDAETRHVPDVMREDVHPQLSVDQIGAERYTSAAVHAQEVEKIWKKVWQMACREEEIPEVGDYIVYDICDMSFIVVRSAPDQIRAYHNSCLHRGRQLKVGEGSDSQFRCPFHGFTWSLQGELKHVPAQWDFPQVDKKQFCLPEAKVGTWGGFVFINPDPQSTISLEDYIKPIPEHFARWRFDRCYKAVHVAKIVRANWKATQEAFMEAFHSPDTHPQIIVYTADTNSQYDVFDPEGHVNRAIHPMAVPSPSLDNVQAQEIVDAIVATSGRMDQTTNDLQVPDGMTAREFMAEINRKAFGAMAGEDFSDVSDAELLDAIVYNAFPNFAPWGGYNPNIIYRFRPNGNDPDTSVMEVMILMRYPKDQPKPDPVPVHWIGVDDSWTKAPELGALGEVFDQDMGNLPYVQRGLHASATGKVTLAHYQESRIRHFHEVWERYIAA